MLRAEVIIYYNYWSSSKPIVFYLWLYHRMLPPLCIFVENKKTNNSWRSMDVFIQGNGYISYFFHECNMTCTCEKCNQKRVIDCQGRCQFAYCSTNTVVCESQLIVVWNDGGKLLGKQFGGRTVVLRSQHITAKSEEHDGKYLLPVVAISHFTVAYSVTWPMRFWQRGWAGHTDSRCLLSCQLIVVVERWLTSLHGKAVKRKQRALYTQTTFTG